MQIRYIYCVCLQSATPATQRWDETPAYAKGSETPGATPSTRIWDATPAHATPGRETPLLTGDKSSVRRNRWDETPRTERGMNKNKKFVIKIAICSVSSSDDILSHYLLYCRYSRAQWLG